MKGLDERPGSARLKTLALASVGKKQIRQSACLAAEIRHDYPVGKRNIGRVGLAPDYPGQRYHAVTWDPVKPEYEGGGLPGTRRDNIEHTATDT